MDKNKLKSLFVSRTTSIKQVIQKLTDTGERILFVVDDQGILCGTLTDGDLRRGIIKGLKFDDSVGSIINKDFISIESKKEHSKEESGDLMIKYEVDRLPVLSEEGKVEDVVSWIDVFGGERKSRPADLYPNKVVIMAGGKGKRLDPFTRIFPKALIPIGDKPVIELIMNKFYNSGFRDFICTLNYKREYLKLYLKDNNFPYHTDWVEEEKSLGTAGSLSLLENKIQDTFFVTNCDTLLDVDYADVLDWHRRQKSAMTIIGCHNEINIPFGILELSDGRLDKMLEKPVHDVIINTGVYVMEPEILSLIPRGEHFDMNELIQRCAKEKKASVYPIYKGWVDVGQWDEFKKNIKHLESLKDEE